MLVEHDAEVTSEPKYRVWVLGGVGEFGRNCTVIEDRSGKLLVIDAGIMFPGPDLPGVQRIIPDFGNLAGREQDIVALLVTHGHEDHLGAIPQFIDAVGTCLVFASPLAIGILDRKLTDGQRQKADIRPVRPLDRQMLGPFAAKFFAANHSIPQTLGILIELAGDLLYFTGDFRLDDVPILGHANDHDGALDEIGERRVRFMFIDSTNAGQDGRTRGETSVWSSIRPLMEQAKGTVYFTTFASHLERQFQALSMAEEFGRRVFVAGRAMRRNVDLARKLGIFRISPDVFVGRDAMATLDPNQLLVLASGSQGEPGSFLDNLSRGSQQGFSLSSDDLIIMSSVPIPGNEPRITAEIDRFMRLGAQVLHYRDAHVHVSGHAKNDELGAIMHAVRPMCVVPVHGDHYNLVRTADLAKRIGGISSLILRTGQVVEVFEDAYEISPRELSARPVFVDDHSSDVPLSVVAERRILRDQGAIVVHVTFDPGTASYSLVSLSRLGFSGRADLEGLVQSALSGLGGRVETDQVSRTCRDIIFRNIAGRRGSQARVVVNVQQDPFGG